MRSEKIRYAFIGVGNMAGAIIGGITAAHDSAVCENMITLFDKNEAQYEKYAGRDFNYASSAKEAVAGADIVVLAVKPQNYGELLGEIHSSGISLDGKVFVSLAAGIDTGTIASVLGDKAHIVRTMPNTPLLIGYGLTALCRNANVTDEEFEEVMVMFSSRGETILLDESDMNGIISVTSSSPAYFYSFIKAMRDGASAQGMDGEALVDAICSVAIGSAMMVKTSGKSLEELIKMVTSYKGTTECALKVFERDDLSSTVCDAMKACTMRAEELGQELKNRI